MEHNPFHLELFLSLLINTSSLRTLESLTTLIPRHTPKKSQNYSDLPLRTHKYDFLLNRSCKTQDDKLTKNLQFCMHPNYCSNLRERYKIQGLFSTWALLASDGLLKISHKLFFRIGGLSNASTVFTTVLFYRMSHTWRVYYIFILIQKGLLHTSSLSSFLTSSQILLSPLEDFIKGIRLAAKRNTLQRMSPSYNCLYSRFNRAYRSGYGE